MGSAIGHRTFLPIAVLQKGAIYNLYKARFVANGITDGTICKRTILIKEDKAHWEAIKFEFRRVQ